MLARLITVRSYLAFRLLEADAVVVGRDVGFSLLVVLSSSSTMSSSASSLNACVA